MTAVQPQSPVPIGYRIAGAFFGLVGIALLLVGWIVRDASWVTVALMVTSGLGLLVPAAGMLFAKTHEDAKKAAAWLMLDLVVPH